MPKNKEKFTYVFNKTLGLEVAKAIDGSDYFTSDGIKYTREERLVLAEIYREIPLDIHQIKKHFKKEFNLTIVETRKTLKKL